MKYLEEIKKESFKEEYEKDYFKNEKYLMASFPTNNLEMYYAPFDYINKNAKVVIIGITSGQSQMEKAFYSFINSHHEQKSDEQALKDVKSNSSFAGPMRKNLISMLDEIGLNKRLNLISCDGLFGINRGLLHSTSALKYPIFKNGKNYTGSSPSPVKNKFLWNSINSNLVPELSNFENKLIIPLGKSVGEILEKLASENKLNNNIILKGFPHPSGANGSRFSQFKENKETMTEVINSWNI
ncbi:uracil-DNA glycosylase family protein [Aureivirga sp. CE67]|uniref:uracil-DNA glycosylase family protein n=1 Tax=Aureivirga sp. CE67 TaxID=1788983 RepID=UPI0018C8FA1A|nr:hypothetical protein [Aureivirga sp. CE67]